VGGVTALMQTLVQVQMQFQTLSWTLLHRDCLRKPEYFFPNFPPGGLSGLEPDAPKSESMRYNLPTWAAEAPQFNRLPMLSSHSSFAAPHPSCHRAAQCTPDT
jgi:hypothetical protein